MFKVKPENITLQHFRTQQMSDSYDGTGECHTGETWTLLIYKDRVVGKQTVYKYEGATEWRRKEGDEIWWRMNAVASAYIRIMRVARYKYFHGKVVSRKLIDTSEENWDRVWLSPEVKKILDAHPQYMSLVEAYGLTLTPEKDHFRIWISKFQPLSDNG